MADDALLRRLGSAAIQKLPLSVQQTMRGVTFRSENGPTQSIASGSQRGNLAGIIPGQNVINIMDQAAFQKAPEQLAMHEAIHKWQDDLPPAIQAQIPPDDPNNPYQVWDTNRVAQLLAHGGTLANLPKEQASATGQYYQAQGGDKFAPKAMRNTYGKLIETMPTVPQSVVMPTDPFQKGINTTLRPPRAPMMMSQQTYTKGQPAEPPPPPGYTVDSEPAPPAGYTLDAGPDTPPAIKPPIPVPQGLQGPPAPTFGSKPSDVLSTMGQHAKNMITGPFHAVMDAPSSPAEQDVVNSEGGGANGRASLALDRLLGVSASKQNFSQGKALWKAGNHDAAVQSFEDAVPVVGPWAKQIETDTQNKGAVAGMAGLATDVFGPTAAARGAGLALKPLARAGAVADVKNMIRPAANDAAFGKSPAEGLLNQPGGVMSFSKPGLLAKTRANIGVTGQQIGDTIAQAPQTPVDVSGAVNDPFQAALQRAAQGNEKGLVSGLKDAQEGYTHDLYFDQGTGDIAGQNSPKNMSMTPSDIFKLKKDVGDGIRWTNQAFDSDLNATRGQVYGGLKDRLNQAVPSLKPLNEQYANMRAGASALERRIPIEERNNPVSLGDMGLAGAGGAIGGGVGAAGLFAAKKLLTSQPVRSAIDQGLWKYGKSPSSVSPSPYRLLFLPPTGSKSF